MAGLWGLCTRRLDFSQKLHFLTEEVRMLLLTLKKIRSQAKSWHSGIPGQLASQFGHQGAGALGWQIQTSAASEAG